MTERVIIIGGGASGLMAAITAAEHGADVTLLEKGSSCGKKLLVSGKGRCNITNMSDIPTLEKNIPTNPRFLRHSFYNFPPEKVVEFFESLGVACKIERGNRVFPVSDNAADVRDALLKEAKKLGVTIVLNTSATDILTKNSAVVGVKCGTKTFEAERVIVTTGGKAFPGTGSNGDGAVLAEKVGHTIVPLRPSLTGISVKEEFITELQGLSLKNVTIKVIHNSKTVYKELGEMLFTHYGLSGPIVLSASRHIEPSDTVILDLKPGLTEEDLDKRILRDFQKYSNKNFKNSLDDLLPKSLIPVIITLSSIDEEKKVNEITKEERKRLVDLLKNLRFIALGVRPFTEAIVTRGGVSVKEINPTTMESKLVQGLYFAGEVIDVDAYTGGFNLQIAFSTGQLAGFSSILR